MQPTGCNAAALRARARAGRTAPTSAEDAAFTLIGFSTSCRVAAPASASVLDGAFCESAELPRLMDSTRCDTDEAGNSASSMPATPCQQRKEEDQNILGVSACRAQGGLVGDTCTRGARGGRPCLGFLVCNIRKCQEKITSDMRILTLVCTALTSCAALRLHSALPRFSGESVTRRTTTISMGFEVSVEPFRLCCPHIMVSSHDNTFVCCTVQ